MSDIRVGMDIFPKVNTGNRTTKIGLEGDFSYTKDYMGVMVGISGALDSSNEVIEDLEQLAKGKRIVLVPAATVQPKSGFKVLVDVNPALYQYGSVNCVSIIEPELGEQPLVYITLRKKLNLEDLEYLVRLYVAGY